METVEITGYRKKGPAWVFTLMHSLSHPRFICKQAKHTYRLFIEPQNPYKPVWVGRKFEHQDGTVGWYTCEAELGFTHFDFANVRLTIFKDW